MMAPPEDSLSAAAKSYQSRLRPLALKQEVRSHFAEVAAIELTPQNFFDWYPELRTPALETFLTDKAAMERLELSAGELKWLANQMSLLRDTIAYWRPNQIPPMLYGLRGKRLDDMHAICQAYDMKVIKDIKDKKTP